jgi:spore coat protein A
MKISRRKFVQTSAMAGAGVLAAQRFAWAFGNSPITIRKFVKRLPSLGRSPLDWNEDHLYIPVAQPVAKMIKGPKNTYKVDYYKFQIAPYTQQLHSDLPGPARFFGYQDITGGKAADPKYLGGVIIATKGDPIQATFVNRMPPAHILPVDATVPGASGVGYGLPNRAAIHFHGGEVPWISDGGPFDWFGPAYDPRVGLSFANDAIPGSAPRFSGMAEYYYPIDQSARLGWYHDHAFGLTRINAYAGMASGLLIVDNFEEALINSHVLPSLPGYLRYGIPLVIQDKTFWDPATDPNYPVAGASAGALWYPWQYEEARWSIGPFDTGKDPRNLPASTVPEFFSDTMIVNGCPYPYLPVEPRHYRFRILNASQARFYNLQLYYEDPAHAGEALLTNPNVPRIIQIGTEGGFLRFPAALNNPPVQFDAQFDGNGNLVPGTLRYNLLIGPGERADVVIDFSDCPVGSNLILYSDTPAPFPGGDSINDYVTGATIGDTTNTTAPGMGPNTRTIMQFRVSPFNTLGQGTKADPAMMDLLEKLAVAKAGVNPFPAIEQFALNTLRRLGVKERWLSLNEDFDEYGRLLQRLGTTDPTSLTPARDPASASGFWLGTSLEAMPTEIVNEDDVEVWHIVNTTADTHPMHFHLVNVQVLERYPFDFANYTSGNPPPSGPVRGPDSNEKGWKETVRMNPGEVTSVVMRFNLAKVPFDVPNSRRIASFNYPNTTTPIQGAEYVWHCHILEHEEHDMMRPLVVIPK